MIIAMERKALAKAVFHIWGQYSWHEYFENLRKTTVILWKKQTNKQKKPPTPQNPTYNFKGVQRDPGWKVMVEVSLHENRFSWKHKPKFDKTLCLFICLLFSDIIYWMFSFPGLCCINLILNILIFVSFFSLFFYCLLSLRRSVGKKYFL